MRNLIFVSQCLYASLLRGNQLDRSRAEQLCSAREADSITALPYPAFINQSLVSLPGFNSSMLVFKAPDDDEFGAIVFHDCKTGRNLVFSHIPKNAGSTIEAIAHKHGVDWGRFSTPVPRTMPDGNTCSGWHVPIPMMPKPNLYTNLNTEVFCVTRDPYDRAVSIYRYLLFVKPSWTASATGLRTYPACSVQGLNHYLQVSLKRSLQGERYHMDCFFVPQSEYIWGGKPPNEKKWCKHVLPISQLTPQFNQLMSERGYNFKMLPKSQSPNVHSDDCPGLSVSSLWPETKELIQRVYSEDLRRLQF